MKSKLLAFYLSLFAISLFITGCDSPTSTSTRETRPPWGKWLPPDAKHPEKRLEVKFGDVLYQVPISYLSGKGSAQKLDDYSYMHAYIIASYPDLVPVHKMYENNIPQFPRIEVILSGHKDDPNMDIESIKKWEE